MVYQLAVTLSKILNTALDFVESRELETIKYTKKSFSEIYPMTLRIHISLFLRSTLFNWLYLEMIEKMGILFISVYFCQ